MTFSDAFFSWRFKGLHIEKSMGNKSSGTEINYNLEILTCDPLTCTMNHPEFIVSIKPNGRTHSVLKELILFLSKR